MRIRIRIQQLKLMRIPADPDLDTDPDPKPWGSVIGFFQIPDPRSRIPDPGSQTHIFESFSDNFLGKKFYNSLKIGPNFFLQHFKNKQFCEFIATKKRYDNKFFRPSLLLLFLDPRSAIRNPGSVMG
jgi:hypothetical protein